MKIQQAKITFNQHGTPESEAFEDLYYSNKSGFDETHYVFIEGNDLLKTWQEWTSPTFTIAETGFGTGLNFLCTARQFELFKQANPNHTLQKLIFISTEKFPLSIADLSAALSHWPQLDKYAQALISKYPLAVSGTHRIELINHHIILDLNFGDAIASFSKMHVYIDGLINAWFLDGFAPRKNDELWSEALFKQVARLSKENASFATFTAASAVRKGLESSGFIVKKRKGFGKKREMIFGYYKGNKCHQEIFEQQHPAYYRAPLADLESKENKTKPHIAVVGAGLAGAISALKLIQQGCKVDLFCADAEVAEGASGNPLGGFYPQLNAEAGINSQIHTHSFMYAYRFYQQLHDTGFEFAHDWCGVLQLGFNPNQLARIQKLRDKASWPSDLIRYVNAQQASEIANIDIEHDALFIAKGGWISPPSLVNACLNYCRSKAGDEFNLYLDASMEQVKEFEDHCTLSVVSRLGELKKTYDGVILAMGSASSERLPPALPYRLTRGQVELVEDNDLSQSLSTVLCHKGYITPSVNGIHAMGSTYVKQDTNTQIRAAESELNVNMHVNAMQNSQWLKDISAIHLQRPDVKGGNQKARAAIRCSLPDHLPVVGQYPNLKNQTLAFEELYKALPSHHYQTASNTCRVICLTGLGSRGLTTAPLMAEIAVSQMLGQALPMQNDLLDALNPNRFLVRALIRRQDYQALLE